MCVCVCVCVFCVNCQPVILCASFVLCPHRSPVEGRYNSKAQNVVPKTRQYVSLVVVASSPTHTHTHTHTHHTHTHTHTDTQTHRHTDTNTHTHTHTDRHRQTQTQTHTDTHTDTQTHRHRQTDRQTQTQTHTPTHTHTHTHTQHHTTHTHTHTHSPPVFISFSVLFVYCINSSLLSTNNQNQTIAENTTLTKLFSQAQEYVPRQEVPASAIQCFSRQIRRRSNAFAKRRRRDRNWWHWRFRAEGHIDTESSAGTFLPIAAGGPESRIGGVYSGQLL